MLAPGHKGIAIFHRLDHQFELVVNGHSRMTTWSNVKILREANTMASHYMVPIIHVHQKRRDWVGLRGAH